MVALEAAAKSFIIACLINSDYWLEPNCHYAPVGVDLTA
jgi:hypothetical protein